MGISMASLLNTYDTPKAVVYREGLPVALARPGELTSEGLWLQRPPIAIDEDSPIELELRPPDGSTPLRLPARVSRGTDSQVLVSLEDLETETLARVEQLLQTGPAAA